MVCSMNESRKDPEIPGENSSFDERLLYCMQTTHKKVQDIFNYFDAKAKKINGKSKGYQTINNWTKKRENIEEPLIYLNDAIALSEFFEVEPMWLLTGQGPYRDLFKSMGIPQLGEQKKVVTEDEFKKHLAAIDCEYVPIYLSEFNPWRCCNKGEIFLSPNTEASHFIKKRFDKVLASRSFNRNTLVNFLTKTNVCIFPKWHVKSLSRSGVNSLRMYYVLDNSMFPKLRLGDLAVVNTDIKKNGVFNRIEFTTDEIYAFVSLCGTVFFRRVQLNYNGTSIKLYSNNPADNPDIVQLSDIEILPVDTEIQKDRKAFAQIEIYNLRKGGAKLGKVNADEGIILERFRDKDTNSIDDICRKYKSFEKIPRYGKLFLIGRVVFKKDALVGDSAFSSFSQIFYNLEDFCYEQDSSSSY